MRAKVVLLSGKGVPDQEIADSFGLSLNLVYRIRSHFLDKGIDSLSAKPIGRPLLHGEETIEKIRQLIMTDPPYDPSYPGWGLSSIGHALGLHRSVVYRLIRKGGFDLEEANRDYLKRYHAAKAAKWARAAERKMRESPDPSLSNE
jgi:transposase